MGGDGTIDERVDPDRLKAERPSWSLFRAHPALGLEETDGGWVFAPTASELGVRWMALDLAEQRARELDLLRALLRRAAASGARFQARWLKDVRAPAELARRCGASLAADGAVCASLTDEAVEPLAATPPELTVVEAAGDHVLLIVGDPPSVGVWMDRWKAPRLERELLDYVFDQAETREQPDTAVDVRRREGIDRAVRAHVVVAWDRHGGKIALTAFGLAALLGWHPLGDNDWADAGVLLVGGVATALGIDRLVKRWYRRSDRLPE